VDTSSEDLNDQELADLMAEPEVEDAEEDFGKEGGGGVEGGIPPEISNDTLINSSEEALSIDDFEDTESISDSSEEEVSSAEQPLPPQVESPLPLQGQPEPDPTNGNGSSPTAHDDGDVAQFRKSLANLSRQLELDRLALLHQTLSGNGEKLPTLGQIADDISGSKSLTPNGDCDQFGNRSTARLDGWLSGLSFGANRRAKKFPK
jgi:hypothetical protein